MAFNYQNLFEEGPENPTYPNQQNPENPEGGGGEGPTNSQTPCAIGYKKQYKPDGSFECVPNSQNYPPCPVGYGRNVITGECIELFPGSTPKETGGCDPGQEWDEKLRRCVPKTSSTGGGGTTPGSGAGGNVPLPPFENPYTDYEKQLWETYNKLFNGAKVEAPYTPEVIARLEGKLKGAAEVNKAANKQNYLAGRSAMGLGNTGRTSQGLRNINNAADQKTAEGAIDINHTAIRANYDAEVANIQRKIQILDSQTQFALALAGNAIERTKVQYNYQLQRMQINNQLEMLKLQLLAQLGAK